MNPWYRARDFLRPIHRTPADPRDAWIHHGFRAGIVLLIALSVPWLFPRSSLPQLEGFQIGSVAPRDVIAQVQFPVLKSREQLRAEQEDAQSAVPTILTRDPTLADTAIARLDQFFAELDSVIPRLRERAAQETDDPEERHGILLAGINRTAVVNVPESLTTDQLEYLTDGERRRRLRNELHRAYDEDLRAGVIDGGEHANIATPSVMIREGGRDQFQPLDSIRTRQDFYADLVQRSAESLSTTGSSLFSALIARFAEPTLRLDVEAMRLQRQQARQSVQAASGIVLEGERIVQQHEPIGEREFQRLESYQAELVNQGLAGEGTGFWRSLGMVLLAASLLGILVYTTYTFRLEIYEDLRSFSVLLFLILFVLAVSGVIAGTGAPPALVPVAFAALLVAALFDAFLAVVVVSAIAGMLLGQREFEGLAVPMLTAAAGVTAAFAVGEIRRRSQSWLLITLISASYLLTAFCLRLIGHFSWGDVLITTTAGFGNATVCTALAMGAVLPALETFTRRTTEQSLLELADMNRPLLRRLAREAPGTYAHSINMANLVEAACSAVGADSLLARVGVYYHDVGKLSRPQYFIENQPRGLNPHDRLRPLQSAEILRAHVREGLKLAEEAKLPSVVKDFIREHHGTQRIEYFLAKARRETPEEVVDPNDFCYPGPKPQTKETGIAMLADAVESASRTLGDPSPERIRALIETLVSDRAGGGQLDECGLTFRDLDRVKHEFAHVLTGLYHHRIDYPDPAGARDRIAEAAPARLEPAAKVARLAAVSGVEDLEDDVEQVSIDLERAAQSDTGPPPVIERAPGGSRAPGPAPPAEAPRRPATGAE